MKKGFVRAVSAFCVLALAGMLFAGCLAFVLKAETPMYDTNAVKAHFGKWGWAYLSLLIILGVTGIAYALSGEAPRVFGKRTEYRRAGKMNAHAKTAVRAALLAAAAALIVPGIINGGLYDVFVKAVNICTECIGLG